MIKENILKVKERISLICSRINRDPNSITIVAASKGRTQDQIRQVVEAGITEIGENRVQEALIKYEAVCGLRFAVCANRTPNTEHRTPIRWHMVGHLQTNKVKEVLNLFDLIQSVDSLRLAQEINKQATKINKIQDILIEVKTSKETTKFGIKPDETIEIIKEITGFKNINIKGLMTIAPMVDNPEKTRPYFRILRELKDEINGLGVRGYGLRILSMGMTDDFEVAIEEGSSMIRLGRAIFEG